MVISEIIDSDVFVFKNNYFFFRRRRKKEENSTALEGEVGPIHPKIEPP